MADTITADKTVTLTASALEAVNECRRLIANAREWSFGGDLSWEQIVGDHDLPGETDGESICNERRAKVDKMEESFFHNFLTMITMNFGEEVKVFRDTEACFFWQYSSGYHGGLIFHRDHSLSNPGDPLTIGTWSLHS